MSDTTMHELCKGFGALLSRAKQPSFIEEASRLNDRGNLPLHAATSFQAGQEVIDALLKAYPSGASQPNNVGNLPIHQAAMWQAPVETVELLLSRYPEGATVRNQYGSLPLHMASSNQATLDVVKLLIDAYPDALHLQNDDGMTPLDLALADESASETVVAMLEGRPPPPEMSKRQKSEKYAERADALERKLASLRDSGGRQHLDLKEALGAVRRLLDRNPSCLYSAGLDPNELEIALSNTVSDEGGFSDVRGSTSKQSDSEMVILDAVKKRTHNAERTNVNELLNNADDAIVGSMDRVEDLLQSLVGLEHIKSQVRGLRRSTEISDLRESLIPNNVPQNRGGGLNTTLIQPALADDCTRRRASHLVLIGNPGTGKSAVARLLAKSYHELGLVTKPKYLEVERMDLVGTDSQRTASKVNEVMEEARGGILFIDEAYTLSMPTKRSSIERGLDAINEVIRHISEGDESQDVNRPLIVLAGFPAEMTNFLAAQGSLRKQFFLSFELPDYTCKELAQIFINLSHAKGFELETSLTVETIAECLDRETTIEWRAERNGRVCELLLSGARAEVRKRMRASQFSEEEVDPQLLLMADVETVMENDFK